MDNYIQYDQCKTLEELEGKEDEVLYPSSLVIKCQQLRRKRLCEFTTEDLRIMIGQQLSLKCLVPMALEVLRYDILASGNYYAGDLLEVMVKVDESFWNSEPQYKEELVSLIQSQIKKLNDILGQLK